jgi:hypothetical protein
MRGMREPVTTTVCNASSLALLGGPSAAVSASAKPESEAATAAAIVVAILMRIPSEPCLFLPRG